MNTIRDGMESKGRTGPCIELISFKIPPKKTKKEKKKQSMKQAIELKRVEKKKNGEAAVFLIFIFKKNINQHNTLWILLHIIP